MRKSNLSFILRNIVLLGFCLFGLTDIIANNRFICDDVVSKYLTMENVFQAMSVENDSTNVDSISKAILKENSISVQFENDSNHPWYSTGSVAKSGNESVDNSTSSLKFIYTSVYQTEVSFRTCNEDNHSHFLKYFVDGIYYGSNDNYKNIINQRFYLPRGKHVVEIRDSISSYSTYNQYSWIDDVCVREILPLEQVVLSPQSKSLTFANDEKFPWTIEDGYIQNSNYGYKNSTTRFSTTFTIDKPHKFGFQINLGNYDYGKDPSTNNVRYHNLKLYINHECYYTFAGDSLTKNIHLDPGTYCVEWVDSIGSSNSNYYSRISNIELSDDWINIELISPGTLGVEVLYQVNTLKDVEMLKVKGTLNDTDWDNIKQMINLVSLDLTEVKLKGIPQNAFQGMHTLFDVKLPDGINYIGAKAFEKTEIHKIVIPSSVKEIGENAFAETPLENISFRDNSKLSTINSGAFRDCLRLKEFIMPNTVTLLGSYDSYRYISSVFRNCSSLNKIVFSDSLSDIYEYTCSECYNLKEVHFPKNLEKIHNRAFYENEKLRNIILPEKLMYIGEMAFYKCGLDSICLPVKLLHIYDDAFSYCANLKYVELPSYAGSYYQEFRYCPSLKKVVCRSATPPLIDRDPFEGSGNKTQMTLVVPSFAVVNYKLDKYWYQFGEIIEGDDVDYWRVAGDLSLTNNRRMNGKPYVDLYYGGKLSIGGNAPFVASQMNFFVSEEDPCRLLNMCEAISVDRVNTYFKVEKDKWYFFTPMYDVNVHDIEVSEGASYVFRFFNSKNRAEIGAGSSWQNVVSEKLIAGQGYIFHCNKNCIITLPALHNVHNQVFAVNEKSLPLVVNESTTLANKNWNYLGNPYPCYYDIYYMDFTAPITVWTGSTYRALSIVDDNYVLRPMETFFVQKPDAIESIMFNPAGKQISSSVDRVSYAHPNFTFTNEKRYVFNLTLGKDEVEDRTRVVINKNRLLDYELECDASKFMSMNSEISQIFTLDNNNEKLSINERPEIDGNVKLGFYVSKAGTYKISVEHADGEIFIYDNETKSELELTEEGYTFNVAVSGMVENRFVLRLKPLYDDVTSNLSSFKEQINVSVDNRTILASTPDDEEICLFTISGRLLHKSRGVFNKTVNAGIYVLVIDGKSYKVVVS